MIDDGLIRTWIDLGAELTDPNLGIEVAVLVSNDARHITADGDGQHRVHRTGRGDGARHDAARNPDGDVTDRRLRFLEPIDGSCAQQ